MAGPHRRYSSPDMGLGDILNRDTTAVREGVSDSLGLRVQILSIEMAVNPPRCILCYETHLDTYPYERQNVVCVEAVRFTSAVGGVHSSSRQSQRD